MFPAFPVTSCLADTREKLSPQLLLFIWFSLKDLTSCRAFVHISHMLGCVTLQFSEVFVGLFSRARIAQCHPRIVRIYWNGIKAFAKWKGWKSRADQLGTQGWGVYTVHTLLPNVFTVIVQLDWVSCFQNLLAGCLCEFFGQSGIQSNIIRTICLVSQQFLSLLLPRKWSWVLYIKK